MLLWSVFQCLLSPPITYTAADKLAQKFRAKTMGLIPEAASFAADLPPAGARNAPNKKGDVHHDNNGNSANNSNQKFQRPFRGKGKPPTGGTQSAPQSAGADSKK